MKRLILLAALCIAHLVGCATQAVDNEKSAEDKVDSLEWQVILLQAQVDRLKEPQILAALQESGCQRGAELYEKMVLGEFVAGSHQGLLCTALRADVREHGSCQRFSDGCEAQLCLTEPHQGCAALRRAEDSHGYDNIKAPVPAADRQGQGSQTN